MKSLSIVLLVLCAVGALAQTSANEKAIRELDKQWAEASMQKNLDKVMAPYADDASMFPPNAPIATGTQQIRATWQHFLSDPNIVSVNFGVNKIVVSRAGDMAYDTGWTEIKMKLANPPTQRGKYVVVWRKIGGKWKAVADIFNDDK
ncbi:MAG: YybH family protein [Terriglobales bacterium]